jgi:hypothetical protein
MLNPTKSCRVIYLSYNTQKKNVRNISTPVSPLPSYKIPFMWHRVVGWGPGTVAEHGTTGILNSALVRMCKQVQKFSYNSAESCLHKLLVGISKIEPDDGDKASLRNINLLLRNVAPDLLREFQCNQNYIHWEVRVFKTRFGECFIPFRLIYSICRISKCPNIWIFLSYLVILAEQFVLVLNTGERGGGGSGGSRADTGGSTPWENFEKRNVYWAIWA